MCAQFIGMIFLNLLNLLLIHRNDFQKLSELVFYFEINILFMRAVRLFFNLNRRWILMKLLIVPIVEKNESLNSYFMKICQENCYPSVSWLFNILGIKDSNLTTNNINDLFKPLSDLTGLDQEIFHMIII